MDKSGVEVSENKPTGERSGFKAKKKNGYHKNSEGYNKAKKNLRKEYQY